MNGNPENKRIPKNIMAFTVCYSSGRLVENQRASDSNKAHKERKKKDNDIMYLVDSLSSNKILKIAQVTKSDVPIIRANK